MRRLAFGALLFAIPGWAAAQTSTFQCQEFFTGQAVCNGRVLVTQGIRTYDLALRFSLGSGSGAVTIAYDSWGCETASRSSGSAGPLRPPANLTLATVPAPPPPPPPPITGDAIGGGLRRSPHALCATVQVRCTVNGAQTACAQTGIVPNALLITGRS